MPGQDFNLTSPAKSALVAGAALGVVALVLDRPVLPWGASAAALVYLGSLLFDSDAGKPARVGGANMLLRAQIRLAQLGYPGVELTGTNDSPTQAAVRQFQQTYGLANQNGEIDSATLAHLEQVAQQMAETGGTR